MVLEMVLEKISNKFFKEYIKILEDFEPIENCISAAKAGKDSSRELKEMKCFLKDKLEILEGFRDKTESFKRRSSGSGEGEDTKDGVDEIEKGLNKLIKDVKAFLEQYSALKGVERQDKVCERQLCQASRF